MRSKHIPLLMSILICITMISVGFSSWVTINPPTDDKGAGSFTAYTILENATLSEFVTGGGMTMFNYSALSFTDAGGNSQDYGLITADYIIDVAKYAEHKGASWDGNLRLQFSLWCENLWQESAENPHNLFTDLTGTYTRTFSVTAKYGTTDLEITPVVHGELNKHIGYVDISGLENLDDSSSCVVSVTYRFDVPRDITVDGNAIPANFRNAFGKYIKKLDDVENGKTIFVTSAEVVEVAS